MKYVMISIKYFLYYRKYLLIIIILLFGYIDGNVGEEITGIKKRELVISFLIKSAYWHSL